MATREERMRQRLRGAVRHQVEDLSFGPLFPDADEDSNPVAIPTTPPIRSTPTKQDPVASSRSHRKRSLIPSSALRSGPRSIVRSGRRSLPADPYEFEDESANQRLVSSPLSHNIRAAQEDDTDELGTLPRPTSRRSHPVVEQQEEDVEVEESPKDAPGSGRRRAVSSGAATASDPGSRSHSTQIIDEEDDLGALAAASSPLARKSKKSLAPATSSHSLKSVSRTSIVGPMLETEADDVDELSPNVSNQGLRETIISPSQRQLEKKRRSSRLSNENEPPQEAENADLAEEIGDYEAAQYLRRKRPRRSAPEPSTLELSPELDSFINESVNNQEAEDGSNSQGHGDNQPEDAHDASALGLVAEPPARKPRRARAPKQPPRGQAKEPTKERDRAKQKARTKKPKRDHRGSVHDIEPRSPHKPSSRRKSSTVVQDEKATIPITIQRFTKRAHYGEEDSDADILGADIPFASLGGVNTVDVLAQMCEEIIETSINRLIETGRNAENPTVRKECRIKVRALEAFQEEVRSRLLQHSILLDTQNSLGKRIRKAQKDKMALRDEILRLRREKEQVALRMDAAREKHDDDSQHILKRLNFSSAMHNVDLATERGRAATELTKKERAADLSGLELMLAGLTNQVCTRSDSGGYLRQIQDFNAFLERTAEALESR